LTCRPEDANFYYKFAEKVVDGTRCDPYSDDICVDGICLPVGCDGKLGSGKLAKQSNIGENGQFPIEDAKKDKCGVCNGDGSQCKTVEGLFDERSLPTGYHDIIALPVGATTIHIEEVVPTSNVFGELLNKYAVCILPFLPPPPFCSNQKWQRRLFAEWELPNPGTGQEHFGWRNCVQI
jgi:hypothetical protein